jgi:DNA-binding protein H-NS
MSTNIFAKPLLNPSPVLTRQLMLGETQLIASNDAKASNIEHVNPGNYRRRLHGMIRKLKSMKIAPKTRNHAGRLLIERSEIAKANLMNSLQCLSETLSQIITLDASIQRNERKQERKRLLRERTNKLSEIAQVMDINEIMSIHRNIMSNNRNISHVLSNEPITSPYGKYLPNASFPSHYFSPFDELSNVSDQSLDASDEIKIEEFDTEFIDVVN